MTIELIAGATLSVLATFIIIGIASFFTVPRRTPRRVIKALEETRAALQESEPRADR